MRTLGCCCTLGYNAVLPLFACLRQVRLTGEATVEVGVPDGWGPVGVDKQQMDHVLAVMEGSLGKAGCDVVVLRRRNTHLHSVDTPGVSRDIALCRPAEVF
jgi:hypothetical protein